MMTTKVSGILIASVVFMAMRSYLSLASDPSSLQDFCIALDNPHLFTNGKFCKDPSTVTSDDFSAMTFRKRGNTKNRNGANVTRADVNTFPGLNTQGISMATIDFAPYGQNQPHVHPRGTELSIVVEGVVLIGFVAGNKGTTNQFFSKVLYPGDLFVVPRGLIHFKRNVGKTPARVIVAFNSQDPGVETIASAMFNSNPAIPDYVLKTTFQVDQGVIDALKTQFK